jgi:hypothetical protein
LANIKLSNRTPSWLVIPETGPVSLTRDSMSKAEISVFESTPKKSWVSTHRKTNPEKQPDDSGPYPYAEQQREVDWNCVRIILQIW